MKKTLSLGLFLLVSLTGCTPNVEPVAEKIRTTKFEHLYLVSEELVANCGASFGIPCSKPLYSVFFKASSSVAAENVCRPVIELQSELGLDAFSAEGSSDIGEVKNVNQVIEFCIQGLEQDLGGSEVPSYFEGTVLYEDGSEDGLGKVTVISRREDGSYFVDFSLGRDKDRIGYFTIQGEPRHQVP